MIPYFPGSVLKETVLAWQLSGRTISSGQTGSGFEPLAETTAGGLWRADLASVPVWKVNQVAAWRALEGLLDSGATQVVVSMCDKRYFPAPTVSGKRLISYGDVPIDTDPGGNVDTLLDDGTGLDQPVVVAYVAADAPLRATELAIAFVQAAPLMGGEHFSIEHPNLGHRVYRVIKVDDGEIETIVTVRPPLREAVQALTDIEFDVPKCTMRIAAADSMRLELSMRRRGTPTASFMESFDAAVVNFVRPLTLPGAAASGVAGPWTDNTLNFGNPDNSQYLPGL
jgi:hypothetical protein